MSGTSGSKIHMSHRIRAEPFIGKSLIESVSGFIQEFAPQTSGAVGRYEDKELILWMKFEECDLTDYSLCKQLHLGSNPPLLLILGYVKGVQVWIIQDNGVAVELVSYRQGTVKCFKILKSPDLTDLSDKNITLLDDFSLKRPLAAICDSSTNFQTVVFQSLKTGDLVKAMKFTAPIQEFYANKKVFVVAFPTDLAVFSLVTLDEMFNVTCCYPRGDDSLSPVALGSAWMAFTDSRLHSVHLSKGGVCPELGSTYKSTMFHAAKSLKKGLMGFGETVASNFLGQASPPQTSQLPRAAPGIVTVIETSKVNLDEFSIQSGPCSAVICHFEAHQGSPLACMEFDASGLLLATADKDGHLFNVFKINPNDSGLNVVQHIYSLKRGDTTAKVLNMTFSIDSRWISVSTHRGTTHVFPITPYGGSIEARTHLTPCVVNRLSKYQRSVGIQESESGYTIPSRTASPIGKFIGDPHGAVISQQYACTGPIVIEPMVQIKQALLQNIFDSLAKPSPSNSPPANSRIPRQSADDVKIACCFGSRRAHLEGGNISLTSSKPAPPFADALFIAIHDGTVVEYDLRPKPSSRIPHERQSESNPIELDAEPIAQWTLLRELCHKEIRPPFHPSNVLLNSLPETIPISSIVELPSNKDVKEQWEAQVESQSYDGPNRRLWMGPQFNFLPTNKMSADAQNEFLLSDGSIPTFVNVASLSNPSEHSQLFGTSFDSESEEYINEIKEQVAEAMRDIRCDEQSPYNSRHHSSKSMEDLDDDDVLDISCESSSRFALRRPETCYDTKPRAEAEFQDITNKLQTVGIMGPRVGKENHPLWGAHTPSLDECRAMTSSAEELSATLPSSKVDSDFHTDWQPIDPPLIPSDPHQTLLERPKPLDLRDHHNLISSSVDMEPYYEENSKSPVSFQCTSAWRNKVPDKFIVTENYFGQVNSVDPQVLSPKEQSSKSISSSSAKSSSMKSSATSANTSEDDFNSREVKNGRKKRKKKNNKTDSEKDEIATILVDTKEVRVGGTALTENLISVDDLCVFETAEMVELDADNFHSAKEYHDVPGEEFHDPAEAEEYSSFNQLEDLVMASDEEVEQCSGVEMLSSIHDEDDLAKALEEASSDESRPVCSCTKPANEMFPFRDASSDDEGVVYLPLRKARYQSSYFDDRDTTSGDDRKTTSESDVTTSPNPNGGSNLRGKKKKKKRK